VKLAHGRLYRFRYNASIYSNISHITLLLVGTHMSNLLRAIPNHLHNMKSENAHAYRSAIS